MAKQIGFIGLGMMGRPMARNLLKAGLEVTVHDLKSESMDEVITAGATGAPSPRSVAERSAVIITMLPSAPNVEAVVLGPRGILEGLKRESVLIDMSTIDPQTTRKLAAAIEAKGGRMLDAPVSRGQPAAIAGTLSIMVGGDTKVFEECRPILQVLGSDIFHCGELGMGEVVKLVNNIMIGIFAPAISEALVFGLKAGASLETIMRVIRASSASNWLLENFFPAKVFNGNFEPGFSIDLMHKDLGLAMTTADALKTPLPLAAVSRQLYGVAQALGRGGQDFTAVIQLLEQAAGVRARSSVPA